MPDVFVSYRRTDSPGAAGRLGDHLSARFGSARVFRDVDSIEAGDDFEHVIHDALRGAAVVVIVIGPRWADARDAHGRRRLDDPSDYVRREIEIALQTEAVLLPVLVEGAVPLMADKLPEPLRPFAWRQALELSDQRWNDDIRRVIAPRSVLEAAIVPTTVILAAGICAAAARFPVPQHDALRTALTFHAPFDGGVDAAHAAGDGRMYSAPSFKERQQARPGLPEGGEVQVARGAGRYGDALRFTKKGSPLVFFQGARNMPYAASNWSGTSLWLSVDPVHDLEPGFCDPIQITPRAWNDAAFFVEFEKRPESIPFRLGVYADFSVWNPEKRRFADIPAGERPLVTVDDPPFGRGRWTHVVFTFERFNTGRLDGVARLYLDGKLYGELSPRQQTFTWDPDGNTIALGLSYVDLLDELAIFDRALTADEIVTLHTLQNGVALLTSPGDFVPRTP